MHTKNPFSIVPSIRSADEKGIHHISGCQGHSQSLGGTSNERDLYSQEIQEKKKIYKIKLKTIKKMAMCVCISCSVLSDSVSSWTVARQVPLSMGFCRQEPGVGCHFLLQRKLQGRRRGRQGMRWLDGITNSTDMSLSKPRDW